MSKNRNRQVAQRIISGLLAAAVLLPTCLLALHGNQDDAAHAVPGPLAIGGSFLFGYFALFGCLPGGHLRHASSAIQRATSRRDRRLDT